MKRTLVVLLAGLLIVPSTAEAITFKIFCGGGHFVRAEGAESVTTVYSIRNGNLDETVVIRRLTIRNLFGTVVWDSGPETSNDHPLNTDLDPDLDITTVPPGASYPINTNHIPGWGVNNIPDGPVGHGNAITTLIELSTEGKPNLVLVGGSLRTRARFVPTVEHSRSPVGCIEVK